MIADSFDVSLRSDTRKVLFGLAGVVAVAWTYLLTGAGAGMEQMDMGGGNMMLMRPEWTSTYAVLVFAMWAVMMAAMMLPGAAPAIVQTVTRVNDRPEGIGGISTALFFTAGYLLVWIGFSVAATLLQWELDSTNLLSETMAIGNAVAASLVVIAVGLYQLTPLKQMSLRRCRSPIDCLTEDQHPSARAIWRLGIRHGVSCLGCCWVLMCLPFVGGLMNPFWMAAVALWVLAEKTLPWGNRIARLSGAGLVAWGGVSLAIAVA